MSLSDGELSEKEVRRIVREELDNVGVDGTSRRNVLKALGVAGAGAALGGGSTAALTQEASATSHAGDIGTPTDRYNVYAQTLDTEQATIGPFDRPLVTTTQPESVNVPADYSTIQAALDDLPLFIDHSFRLTVDAGTYNEDLYVPPVIARFIQANRTAESPGVEIKGDPTTPSNVTINSAYIDSAQGASAVRLRGFEITSGTPYGDEYAAVDAAGCQEVNVHDCNITHGDGTGTDGSVGISAESSGVEVNNVDLGTGLQLGFDAKHMSFFNIVAGSVSGSPKDLYRALQGLILTGDQPATPTNTLAPDNRMPIFNHQGETLYSNPLAPPSVSYPVSQGTATLLDDSVVSSNRHSAKSVQYTDGVGTAAATIFDAETATGKTVIGNLVLVQGDDGSTNRFTDLVLHVRGGNITTVASQSQGTPAARTYSEPSPGNLGLAMGSGSANVVAIGFSTGVF